MLKLTKTSLNKGLQCQSTGSVIFKSLSRVLYIELNTNIREQGNAI